MKPSTKFRVVLWNEGITKKQVADELSVSPTYVNMILHKLDSNIKYEPKTKLAQQVKTKILNILDNSLQSLEL